MRVKDEKNKIITEENDRLCVKEKHGLCYTYHFEEIEVDEVITDELDGYLYIIFI